MHLAHPVRSAVLAILLSLSSTAVIAEVVAVVASTSPVTHLSKSQVANIFLGKSKQYPNGGPAVPIDQAEGSTGRNEFYTKASGKSPAQIKAYWSKIIFTGKGQPPKVIADSTALKQLLASNPSAISYMEQSLVDTNLKVVKIEE
jgi:ABC-type phosphate transport system substrate-binding protein